MKKLYYEDSELITFKSEVLSCTPEKNGRYLVTLNQTAFYPEGGGQPYDTGVLGDAAVLEVHEKNGEVLHTTDSPLEPGSTVSGTIDWERRLGHMQNHSGEHILSGMIHRRFGYDNVGFHMGTDAVTIDFNGTLTPEQLAEAEAEANKIVFQNVPILVTYPSGQELEQLDYRSKKELTGQVRIVTIPQGDVCACCGTHVKATGAIGLIKTTDMIHYKGGVRITMLCGMDALKDYGRRLLQVTDLSHLLSAKPDLVVDAVAKLKAEASEKDLRINRLYQKIFEKKAESMPENDGVLCVFEEDLEPVWLRRFCTLLYEKKRGKIVVVCSKGESGCQFALGSGLVDVRPVAKELNSRLSGRGGGSSLMVQGVWNAAETEIRTVLRELEP